MTLETRMHRMVGMIDTDHDLRAARARTVRRLVEGPTGGVRPARARRSVAPADLADIRDKLDREELRRKLVDVADGLEATRRGPDDAVVYYDVAAPADDLVALARAALTAVCTDLALPRPQLRWMRPETPAEARYAHTYGDAARADIGEAFAGPSGMIGRAHRSSASIWLAQDIERHEVTEIVAHECRHLQQAPTMATFHKERDAEDYASNWRLQ